VLIGLGMVFRDEIVLVCGLLLSGVGGCNDWPLTGGMGMGQRVDTEPAMT